MVQSTSRDGVPPIPCFLVLFEFFFRYRRDQSSIFRSSKIIQDFVVVHYLSTLNLKSLRGADHSLGVLLPNQPDTTRFLNRYRRDSTLNRSPNSTRFCVVSTGIFPSDAIATYRTLYIPAVMGTTIFRLLLLGDRTKGERIARCI